MEGTWLTGQQPWAARLLPGAWALLPLLSKVGVDQPLLINSLEKSAEMHIPSEAYDSSGCIGFRVKTAPSIRLLVMNYSEGIGFLSITDLSSSLLDARRPRL